MEPVPDVPDRYVGTFTVTDLGEWEFGVEAWTDPFAQWQDELRRRVLGGPDRPRVRARGGRHACRCSDRERRRRPGDDRRRARRRHPAARTSTASTSTPLLARFGSWFELFPRSFGGLRGVEQALPRLAELGFDVVYLPPIHPIGSTNRKGRDNALVAAADDPGSPWAIGSPAGGHTAVHPELGTIDDLDRLVEGGTRPRHRGRARPGVPGVARPPVADRASRLVPAPRRRHGEVRGEPPEALRGHRQLRLRVRRLAVAVGRARGRRRLLDRSRHQGVPRRQPAHQAARVLGGAAQRDPARRTRT